MGETVEIPYWLAVFLIFGSILGIVSWLGISLGHKHKRKDIEEDDDER